MAYRLGFFLALMLAGTLGYAQQSLNLGLLKRDTQIFEDIVERILKQNFTNPFALAKEPEAAYLQGYGIVVSFHLNINRKTIRTPFGEIEDPRGTNTKTKTEQIRLVRDGMIQCLADYGSTIKQLNGHDRISITAHIEDRNELNPENNRTVLVLTATKDDVDLFTLKKMPFEKFKQEVHVLQY